MTVIPSEARNPSSIWTKEKAKKEGFLASLGMTAFYFFRNL